MRQGKLKMVVGLGLIMMTLVSCGVIGANRDYVAPDGCADVGVINNLREGTDLSTQIAFYMVGVEVPEVRQDLIGAFEDFKAVLVARIDLRDTIMLAEYLRRVMTDINANYSTLVVMMTPALQNVLDMPEFQEAILFGDCDYHRLTYWADANLKNLRNIK